MKVYIRNKFISVGGSSIVKDENGQPIYDIKGKAFSFTRLKSVCDMNGNVLYRVRNKFFNFFVHRAYIEDAAGNTLATVRDKYFNVHKEYFTEGYPENIRTEGKFFSLSCNIYRGDTPIGTIRRKIHIVDAFELEAAPEDIPFLIAFVIAIDNIIDNRQNDLN